MLTRKELDVNDFEDIATEAEVMEFFSVTRDKLDLMRRKQKLPYIKVTHRSRLYIVTDVLEWLITKRIVM